MIVADRYRIGNKIGVGGMGTVFLGEDTQSQTPVAIKQLKPEVVQNDPDQVQRFIREGQVLRQLNHPNIVKMLEAIDVDDSYYLVMEYVDGGSLLDVLRKETMLSIQRVLYIALDLADALTRAHRLSVLHRDIKPANVLIASDGTPRLTDFGMAHIDDSEVTQEGAVLGTLAYLSPESLQGDIVDDRSDIWSFGIMLYEMLTGKRPFGKTTAAGPLINAILTQPIQPIDELRADIPTSLADLLNRMLERDLHTRIPSVRVVGAELEAIIRGKTTSMQPVVSLDDTTGRFDTDQFTPAPGDPDSSQVRPAYHLPTQPTPFVGRERELNEMRKLMQDSSAHLMTLVGPGGVGKSRLGLAAAAACVDVFEDGVYFVGLAPVEDESRIAPTIAESVGFSFSGTDDPKRQIIDFVSDKHMLLVLDNFEHLMDAAGFVADMLREAPNLRLIVTSRERLRLRGEQVYDVGSLDIPEPTLQAGQMAGYHSVRLFMQSARHVMPDFELDAETAPHVARVIDLVQGLPLGIELAAAWLESLPLEEIAGEIENSLDFLETDLRDVPERHRSIRAVFEYSWNLMTEDERETFMRLSVFRDGFEREAAQKVAGASLRTLTNLTNKSLIRRDVGGRYHLHNMLRSYAEEHFDDDAERKQAITKAHATYYGEMLSRMGDAMNSHKEVEAFELMDREMDNIRAAWRTGIEAKMWDHVGTHIHTIGMYMMGRSLMRDGARAFADLSAALEADQQQMTTLYCQVQLYRAKMLNYLGQFDEALALVTKAQAYFEKTDNLTDQGYALTVLSDIHLRRGEFDLANQYAAKAIKLYETSKHLPSWYIGMSNMAAVELQRGNYPQARRMYMELLNLCEDLRPSPIFHASALDRLGEVEREMGHFDRAFELYQEAYDIYKSFKQTRGMASALNNLAGLHYNQGNYDDARQMYEKAYGYFRDLGDRIGLGHSLSALGNLAAFKRDLDSACDFFEQALETRRSIQDKGGIADSSLDLAQVYTTGKDYDGALRYIDEAEPLYDSIGDRQGLGYARMMRAQVLMLQGDYAAANQLLDDMEAEARALNAHFLTMRLMGVRGDIALAQEDYDGVYAALVEVARLAIDNGSRPALVATLQGVVPVLMHRGERVRALALLILADRYPGTYVLSMIGRTESLRTELLKQLDTDEVQKASNLAAELTLEDAVNDMLAEAAV